MDANQILSTLRTTLHSAACHQQVPPGWLQGATRVVSYCRMYWLSMGRGSIAPKGRRHELLPGHLYLLPRYTDPRWDCSEAMFLYWFRFNSWVLGNIDFMDLFDVEYEVIPPNRSEVQNRVERILELKASDKPGDILEADGIFRQLLSFFLNTSDPNAVAEKLGKVGRFQAVLSHIDENIHRHISVSEMADITHLERIYFTRLFAKTFGIPPAQYVLRQRISMAQDLIMRTDDTITRIAEMTGFNDVYHFSGSFKKVTGVSPTQFRSRVLRSLG